MVKNRLAGIDWQLLIFLVLVVNVKLVVKAAALVIIYLLRPNFKFGLSLKNSRLPLFYVSVILIALLNYLLYGGFSSLNYSITLCAGIVFWLMCILAIHQVKLSVEKNSTESIHQTVFIFFLLNAAVSLVVYTGIIIETGAINPYRYQGNYQKYFIGTGDYIKGLSFDTSTTNAVLNAFAVLYFLLRQKFGWCIFYMCILLLTGSNVTNFLLCTVLLYVFVFKSTQQQKSIIVACFALLIIFLSKVSPQNNNYIASAWKKVFKETADTGFKPGKEIPLMEKPDSILSEDEKKQKFATRYIDSVYTAKKMLQKIKPPGIIVTAAHKEKPQIPKDNIHSAAFQHKNDTSSLQKGLITFIKKDSVNISITETVKLPGKAIALMEVFTFFKEHPLKLLTGNGMGNFSSKLAFRTTALKIAGGYPERFKYIHPDFEKNHLALYIGYFTKTAGQHSLINKPDSVYGQVLAEYGLAGLAALFVLYGWFFARRRKQLTWGWPILLFTMGLFFLEYWFEQLSVMVFFELLLFLNLKETKVHISR